MGGLFEELGYSGGASIDKEILSLLNTSGAGAENSGRNDISVSDVEEVNDVEDPIVFTFPVLDERLKRLYTRLLTSGANGNDRILSDGNRSILESNDGGLLPYSEYLIIERGMLKTREGNLLKANINKATSAKRNDMNLNKIVPIYRKNTSSYKEFLFSNHHTLPTIFDDSTAGILIFCPEGQFLKYDGQYLLEAREGKTLFDVADIYFDYDVMSVTVSYNDSSSDTFFAPYITYLGVQEIIHLVANMRNEVTWNWLGCGNVLSFPYLDKQECKKILYFTEDWTLYSGDEDKSSFQRLWISTMGNVTLDGSKVIFSSKPHSDAYYELFEMLDNIAAKHFYDSVIYAKKAMCINLVRNAFSQMFFDDTGRAKILLIPNDDSPIIEIDGLSCSKFLGGYPLDYAKRIKSDGDTITIESIAGERILSLPSSNANEIVEKLFEYRGNKCSRNQTFR